MKKTGIALMLMLAMLICSFSAALAEIEPEESTEAVLSFEQQEDLESRLTWEVFDQSGRVNEYHRGVKERIYMGAGDDYTRMKLGVLTFRNNAFRQNASAGTVTDPSSLQVLWQVTTGYSGKTEETANRSEWTGQPVIMKWSLEVREASKLKEEKRNKKALKEAVVPGSDGKIYFLDPADGTETRDPIQTQALSMGTPCMHPIGIPYMNVSQTILPESSEEEYTCLSQYNLYTQEELAPVDKPEEETGSSFPGLSGIGQSSLIDRMSDTVITAGKDGTLCLITLNSSFDWHEALYSINPSIVSMRMAVKGKEKAPAEIRAAVAMVDHYAFTANMDGILCCVDTDTLAPVWMAETGDSVLAAVALDQQKEDELDLYTANTLNHRERGDVQVRRYNALNGAEIWHYPIMVEKDPDHDSATGFAASPVIGTGMLNDLVFFTVTGLNEEGTAALNLEHETKAAVIALEKETGILRWAKGLESETVSSPAAIYDEEGNGWVIQCSRNGEIVLLDGQTGEEITSLALPGKIYSSPAVYNNVMVVTTIGEQEAVYGILIDKPL